MHLPRHRPRSDPLLVTGSSFTLCLPCSTPVGKQHAETNTGKGQRTRFGHEGPLWVPSGVSLPATKQRIGKTSNCVAQTNRRFAPVVKSKHKGLMTNHIIEHCLTHHVPSTPAFATLQSRCTGVLESAQLQAGHSAPGMLWNLRRRHRGKSSLPSNAHVAERAGIALSAFASHMQNKSLQIPEGTYRK